MKYVLAVSGGVDSVVLLDMAATGRLLDSEQLIVAHFDHGIRADSAKDEVFVRQLAHTYDMQYESQREELGSDASEELARDQRYAFLRRIAKKYTATIVTAHHADDIIETIAINLERGTGWRGLAVLDSSDIVRPLLAMRKSDLLDYAKDHSLEWHEDSTNDDIKYLRNRLRRKLSSVDDETIQILQLYRNRQVAIKSQIDDETARAVGVAPNSRYLFISVPNNVGRELVRSLLITKTGSGATRPQLERALNAIKTFAPGKRYEITNGVTFRFTKTDFIIE